MILLSREGQQARARSKGNQLRLAQRRAADDRAATMGFGPVVARIDAAIAALEAAADRALLAALGH